MTDRMPPFSREAEINVLGSIMQDNYCLPEVMEILSAQSFYLDIHQKIFRVILDLRSETKPIDLVIVLERLRDRGWIADISIEYLRELLEAAPTAANAVYYAGIVRDKALSRRLIQVCTEAVRDCYDHVMPIHELIDSTQRQILSLGVDAKTGSAQKFSDVINEFLADLDEKQKNHGLIGIPSGLLDLDELTGGFHPNELCVLAARPSIGKTALAGNVVRNSAGRGVRSFVVSIEQSKLELTARWFAGETDVSTQQMRKGRLAPDQVQQIILATDVLRPLPIWINDCPSIKVNEILTASRRLKQSDDIQMVVIDYLQKIVPDNRHESRNEQVACIARGLKQIARELKIVVLGLCQLSRAADGQRPSLSHLRDSGEIEQEADTVIFLHRPNAKTDAPTELIEAIVDKQRNGPCGACVLSYRKRNIRFENYAQGIPM